MANNNLPGADDGNDLLIGGAGRDFLSGSTGNDTIRGAGNDDQIFREGGDSAVVVALDDGPAPLEGGSGTDTVQVNGADGAGDDFYFVGDDIDAVKGYSSNTSDDSALRGGEGNDTVQVNGSNTFRDVVAISEPAASDHDNDFVQVNGANGAGDGFFRRDDFDPSFQGNDGGEGLEGGLGNDFVQVNGANGAGDDFMLGGEDIDTVQVNGSNTAGESTLPGGEGLDTVQVNGANGAGDSFLRAEDLFVLQASDLLFEDDADSDAASGGPTGEPDDASPFADAMATSDMLAVDMSAVVVEVDIVG